MMEVAKPEQFDLDHLAEELGKLPNAPLAMPVQDLEYRPQRGGLWAALRLTRVRKAGH
ncbi:hypothetical protein [Paragemmobacter ruber]|uniref:Transposase n=1 Tax=Paragemmobacter ruber TaxID=1985673 RepID=A0ABW9Y2Y9_9RHOB|nr:hypothetical protein [Rhodobacter ruber]NBE06870.1 hypothetical protein [Rhodobacter ruber]